MLTVQLATRGRDIEQGLLEAGHVALDEGDTEVERLLGGGSALGDEAIRDSLALLVQDEVAEGGARGTRGDGDEGGEEEELERAEDTHGWLSEED